MVRTLLGTVAVVSLTLTLASVAIIAQAADVELVEIRSEGSSLQARFYSGECSEACPTLLLIPGFPGSALPDVLGLGARLSGEGMNVLVVNPRGLQESEGTMSFFNALDDIGAAFEWLQQETIRQRFNVDTSALVLGGHSFGGGTALAYAARDPRARALVSIAGTDHGQVIRDYQSKPAFAEMLDQILSSSRAPDGPARFDPEVTMRELAENQHIFGLRENAEALADRSILLIGGWEDANVTMEDSMTPLYRALQSAGAGAVTFLTYQDDHGFGQVRDRLAADLRQWVLYGSSKIGGGALPPSEARFESNKAIARRWFEDIINRRNLDALPEIYAEDYVHHGPEGQEIRGLKAVRGFAAAILNASEDRHAVIDQQVAEGDLVVTRFTSRGHHTGPFQGRAATDAVWTTEGIVISRIENGKIVEDWEIIHASGL